MGKKHNKFTLIFLWIAFLTSIIWVYKSWFGLSEISSGDSPFFFTKNNNYLTFYPYIWNYLGTGFFNSQLFSFFYMISPIKILSEMSLPWVLIERISWYWPFLIFGTLSSYYLVKTISPNLHFKILSPFIYLINSYILMITGGGQVSIFLSYALVPLIVGALIRNINNGYLSLTIFSGIIIALSVSIEPRITLLALSVASLYAIFKYRMQIKSYLFPLVFPIILAVVINLYWLLPPIIFRQEQYLQSLSVPNWLNFLSFADFSKSLSLLHPNWPENIFGKTYFTKPEFLLIPIIAYLSIFFSKNNYPIRFFIVIGLLGSFLAKGVNPPFGDFYRLLFNYLPGFNMFRDPTKFYILTALSYSILIPFTIENLYNLAKTKLKNINKYIIAFFLPLLLTIYILILWPAYAGHLRGTFERKSLPKEYLELKDLITSQNDFFRTFWIPAWHKFGYFDNTHPAISADYFYGTNDHDELINKLKEEKTEKELQELGVKYIVIPFDSENTLFLTERIYDPQKRKSFEDKISQITWLQKIQTLGKITVFETSTHNDLFRLEKENDTISYEYLNPTKYLVRLNTITDNDRLNFSQSYNPYWVLKTKNLTTKSEKNPQGLNSFLLPSSGKLEGTIEFLPQRYLEAGITLSGLILITSIFFLFFFKYRKK